MYNINTEKNSEILKKCETLRQYSRFVEVMRSYKETAELTNEVIVEIIGQCKREGVLTEFLDKYGTEIVEMLFKELTREEDLEISRLDGYDEGERAGIAQEKLSIAKNLLAKKMPAPEIAEITGLTLSEVAQL